MNSPRTLSTLLQTLPASAPRDTLSFLPPRAEKPKKKRAYKTRVVSFYLHPRLAERSANVRAKLEEIAALESAPMDQVKFELVDFGSACYAKGTLPLPTRPNPVARKLTIEWVESDVWPRRPPVMNTNTPPSAKKGGHPTFSFRGESNEQSARMKAMVERIASQHAVTPGEVLIYLLEHAIERYFAGGVSFKKKYASVETRLDGYMEKTE